MKARGVGSPKVIGQSGFYNPKVRSSNPLPATKFIVVFLSKRVLSKTGYNKNKGVDIPGGLFPE
jgi:hypothetical protein